MRSVTVRELRNRGGEVLTAVERGEHLVVTRDGAPVAELRPLRRRGLSAAELVARFQQLPPVDPNQLRRDIDEILDQRL